MRGCTLVLGVEENFIQSLSCFFIVFLVTKSTFKKLFNFFLFAKLWRRIMGTIRIKAVDDMSIEWGWKLISLKG